jgi:hypothetical protein
VSSDLTYPASVLMQSLEALLINHPMLDSRNVDVVVELCGNDGTFAPGDLLGIKSITFNVLTGKIHLLVEEADE